MKLFLIIISIFIISNSYSQNSYNITVQAENIRLWAKPIMAEIVPESFLKVGEKIRIIDVIIEDRQPNQLSEKFYRIYRNGNTTTPFYVNLEEVYLNKVKLQLQPTLRAITEERKIENIWFPLYNKILKLGETIYFNGNSKVGVYSNLNRAALNKSQQVTDEFIGFYTIKKMIKCKSDREDKVILFCEPKRTPFNGQVNKPIYIDYFTVGDRFKFHSLNFASDYFNLLLKFAYSHPTGETPNEFYSSFISSLYNEATLDKMDEFRKNRLFSSGKKYMDSIFNTRLKVFSIPLSDVFYSSLSSYDFNSSSFEVEALKTTDNSLNTLGGSNSFGGPNSIDNFINLPLYNPQLKMEVSKAENFIKELNAFPLMRNVTHAQKREIIFIAHYKYIPVETAKVLYKKFDTYVSDFTYHKVIDSMEVYSSKNFTKSALASYFALNSGDKSKIQKWASLLPDKIQSSNIVLNNSNDNRDDEEKVDQGRVGGVPGGKDYTGTPKNFGVKVLQISNKSFEDDFNENARIAMEITVDVRGKVTSAVFNLKNSTSNNRSLIDIAKRKAFELKFGSSDGGQKGLVVFDFKVKG